MKNVLVALLLAVYFACVSAASPSVYSYDNCVFTRDDLETDPNSKVVHLAGDLQQPIISFAPDPNNWETSMVTCPTSPNTPFYDTCSDRTTCTCNIPLTYIFLCDNWLTKLLPHTFSGLSSVTSLYIHSKMLTSLPLGALSGLSSLQTLYIQFSKMEFTVLPPDTFSGLSSLKILYLLGKLQCAPLTAQARTALTVYRGPTLCLFCESGKYPDYTRDPAACVTCGAGKYGNGTTPETAAECTDCEAGTYSNANGATICTDCVAGKYSNANGSTLCTDCVTGKFSERDAESSCTACGAFTYASREGATTCTTCEPGKYSGGVADKCITFVAAETSECCAAVEQLGNEVERLKHQVTPRSSFIPTGNRTMPAWGNSGYSRCQFPFSWSELNKVISFIGYYPIVSPFFVFHKSCFIEVSDLKFVVSLFSFFLYDVFHYIHYIQGYKDREIMFRTGGLGRHIQENVYEIWMCMDHYCGDPVFCWVYHEIDKVFTPWGPNSELLLITEL